MEYDEEIPDLGNEPPPPPEYDYGELDLDNLDDLLASYSDEGDTDSKQDDDDVEDENYEYPEEYSEEQYAEEEAESNTDADTEET